MTQLNIRSAELARSIPVDPALVSRWRTGRRVPKDEDTVGGVASFLNESAKTEREKAKLGDLLADYEEKRLNTAEKIALWLFDGRGLPVPSTEWQPQPAGVCFPGADGFLTALSMLEYAVRRSASESALVVYVSTERLNLILNGRTDGMWERLYALNRGPVPVILERTPDAERLSMVLAALLGHIQSGRLLLSSIPTGNRQFYYNLTVLAKGVGMVIAMEPPVSGGESVSLFVDMPSFVRGVGAKLSELNESAKPMFKLLRDTAAERSMFKKCFQGEVPVSAMFGTVNLLYADPDGYRELLKANGVPYESRRWRISEFSAVRRVFEEFLARGDYREMASLTALGSLSKKAHNTVPELMFINNETIEYPPVFLKSLFRGMLDFLHRFPGLDIALTRAERRAVVTRISQDSVLLLQNITDGVAVSLGSENWLVVNEYTRAFDAAWNSGDDIFGKHNVICALTRLYNKLEGNNEL